MRFLKFDNVTFGYNKKKPIFQNVSFEINMPPNKSGCIFALMGASGTGKSTLLKLILGIEKPHSGTISSSPEAPVIAYLPQDSILFEHLSPIENARYFSTISNYRKIFDEAFFTELVETLNLEKVLSSDKSVLELSGGERQRISLLRAMSIRPDFLLLDEPTTGLDAEVKMYFLIKLREVIQKNNVLVIYVTHHRLESELIVDEILYLKKNENTGSINRVFSENILSFISEPPILEAVKVFDYPKQNIIKCLLNKMNLELTESDENNSFYLRIKTEDLQFSEDGFAFDVISENSIFSIIRLEGQKQYLTIKSSQLGDSTKRRLLLNGLFTKYDLEGVKVETINIHQNLNINQ